MSEPEPIVDATPLAPVVLDFGRHAPDDPGPLGPAPNLDTVETETRHYRHDGWTPKARADFFDKLATSGVITDACRVVARSSQAAYALRNRDALFAAGWDAALSMARARLADELYHRAVGGTVDQIWKDGEVVAERHRHDNRLSIAVLNRLDARCDRAERVNAPSLGLIPHWDAYLAALGEDRTADAAALLTPPPADDDFGTDSDSSLIHQLHQLREGKALDEDDTIIDDDDDPRVWPERGTYRTNFPPPDGFTGFEHGVYGDGHYTREVSPAEHALLDHRFPETFVDCTDEERRTADAERDAYFAGLGDPPASPADADTAPPAVEMPPDQCDM